MILYLDGMAHPHSGIARIHERLLAALLAAPGVEGVQTILPRASEAELRRAVGAQPKLELRGAPFAPFSVRDFTAKSRLAGSFGRRAELAVFPNVNLPVGWAAPSLVTVNDLIMMGPSSSWSLPKRWAFRALVRRALARASGLVFLSAAVRDEVERRFGLPDVPVAVIPPALAPRFLSPVVSDPAPLRVVEEPYLLHVGIRVRHKNHAGIVRGWLEARRRHPGLRLVLVGRRLWRDDVDRLRADLGLGAELVEIAGASDEEIVGLYRRASAFVFPSWAEGFGMPPLEAMAVGTPVVAADIPVLRETLGEAALFSEPGSAREIGDALCRVLEDDELRARLVAAGRRRAAGFGDRAMVAGYLELIERVRAHGAS